ncbi:unnamed protein product [Lasius platythorax]|uniref:Uncharacterized protein n=1 Tax=Lasius platythorax TaxID=488582 RepID=A0AAV2NRB9_9HYME
MTVLLSARNQSTATRLSIHGTHLRYKRLSPKRLRALFYQRRREARGRRGSCSCRRGQGRLPKTKTCAAFPKEWTRGLLTKGSTGFRHPHDDDDDDEDEGKEVSIRRVGLNNSGKGPSLGPLTRECNLLAPARDVHRGFSSLHLSFTYDRGDSVCCGFPLSSSVWLKSIDPIINSEDEREDEIDLQHRRDAPTIKIR